MVIDCCVVSPIWTIKDEYVTFLEDPGSDSFFSSFELIDSEIRCEDGLLVSFSKRLLSLVEKIESFLYVSRREIGDSIIIVNDIFESREGFERMILDIMLRFVHLSWHESCSLGHDVLLEFSFCHEVCIGEKLFHKRCFSSSNSSDDEYLGKRWETLDSLHDVVVVLIYFHVGEGKE